MRIVVGFPPGSATDTDMRLLAAPLGQKLGQEFIVENKPGAGSNLAAEIVSRATPDGYTLLAMTVTNAVNATLYQGLSFDIQKDIAPVIGTFESPNCLVVTPSVPAKTLPEFIAYAKANPGKINYASFGIGSAPNMNGELLKLMAGINLVHVPYRQSPVPDLLSGQVQAFIGPLPVTIAFVRSGKLRALAMTSAKRNAALPDVPTVAETVPGFEAGIWHGIGAPKGTPKEIIATLNKETQRHSGHAGNPAEVRQHRRHGHWRHAGSLWQVHRRRDREVGQGHQGGEHQAGVRALVERI